MSDWSSGVLSSNLTMGFPFVGAEEGDVGRAAEARLDHVGNVAVPVDADLLDHPAEVAKAALDGMLGEHDRLVQRGHQPLGRVETEPGGEGSVADEADPFRKIGRASCRERVCQYV